MFFSAGRTLLVFILKHWSAQFPLFLFLFWSSLWFCWVHLCSQCFLLQLCGFLWLFQWPQLPFNMIKPLYGCLWVCLIVFNFSHMWLLYCSLPADAVPTFMMGFFLQGCTYSHRLLLLSPLLVSGFLFLGIVCLTMSSLKMCVTQVKLWYDKVGHQLIVTVLGAKELPVQDDGRPRNPYVKIYLLPDRR